MKTIHYIILFVVLAIAGGLIYFNERKKKDPNATLTDLVKDAFSFSDNNNKGNRTENITATNETENITATNENEIIYGKPEGFRSPNDRIQKAIENSQMFGSGRWINKLQNHLQINNNDSKGYSYYKNQFQKPAGKTYISRTNQNYWKPTGGFNF